MRGFLDDLQARLLLCLGDAPGGLTVKQLEARVPCACGELDEALQDLVEKRRVSDLNTIIPTYVVNTTSIQVPTE
jgi:hypothetical protein